MKSNIIIDSLRSTGDSIRCVGYWPTNDDVRHIPIYHVNTPNELNRVVGYAKFINGSNGTVLYRGQNKAYQSLIPSGARSGSSPVTNDIINRICEDEELLKFFKLEEDSISGWKQYRSVIIESVLQHYGAKTYCMDFVDNHWCALWFGLYEFSENKYTKRKNDNDNLYIFLYLAETNGPCIRGLYIGENTYTVDLRRAVPSTFQRPSSQHGWIVRKHKRESCNYDDNIIGVIEVSIKHAKEWLGDGALLSQDNFFPSFSLDQGYKVLLLRQQRSGLSSNHAEVLPINTICNYHLNETYFSSTPDYSPLMKATVRTAFGIQICKITELYEILLTYGWSEKTCSKIELWNPQKPWINQSAATSLLVYKCFGGNIYSFSHGNEPHYYNVIEGHIFDLTSSEVISGYDKLLSKSVENNIANVFSKNRERYTRLISASSIKIDNEVIIPQNSRRYYRKK